MKLERHINQLFFTFHYIYIFVEYYIKVGSLKHDAFQCKINLLKRINDENSNVIYTSQIWRMLNKNISIKMNQLYYTRNCKIIFL